jgi:farnesyl diphosphate synthase
MGSPLCFIPLALHPTDHPLKFQAYFLVSDDMMDGSTTRRGQPCWYRLGDVGLKAANDSLILEGAIFQTIRKHFRNDPFYADINDLLHEVCHPLSP